MRLRACLFSRQQPGSQCLYFKSLTMDTCLMLCLWRVAYVRERGRGLVPDVYVAILWYTSTSDNQSDFTVAMSVAAGP